MLGSDAEAETSDRLTKLASIQCQSERSKIYHAAATDSAAAGPPLCLSVATYQIARKKGVDYRCTANTTASDMLW